MVPAVAQRAGKNHEQGQQRRFGRVFGVVPGEGPARAPADRFQPSDMRGEARAVFAARAFDPAHQHVALALHALEAGAPPERQAFLRGVEDLQQMPVDPAAGETAYVGVDLLERRQEIADHDQMAVPWQRFEHRQAFAVPACLALVEQGVGGALQPGAAARRHRAVAEEGDVLAAAHQQRGEREQQQIGPVMLFRQVRFRAIAHGGRIVAPQPDALRRFPFGLAHEQVPGLGRLAPVDRLRRIGRLVAAELPEGFSLTDPAAAVHALRHGRGDPFGRHQKRRQPDRHFLGAMPVGLEVGGGRHHAAAPVRSRRSRRTAGRSPGQR